MMYSSVATNKNNCIYMSLENHAVMKKLIFFACSLMVGVSAYAQDVLITNNGDVKNVNDVEVGTNAVFYK